MIAKRAHQLVEAVLHTLLAYLEWVPLNFILDTKFDVALCQLIQEQSMRLVGCFTFCKYSFSFCQTSCECLLVIMSRKSSKHDLYKLLFPFEHLDILANSVSI